MRQKLVVLALLASIFVVTSTGKSQAWTSNDLNATVAQFGGINDDRGSSVAVDSSGNTYVAGDFTGAADFDPGVGTANLTSTGNSDAYVVKLNSSGTYVWARQFGGTGADHGSSVAVDSSGNTYVAGHFSGTADFDPGVGTANLTSTGNSDAYVVKLNSSGVYVWAKKFGGTDFDYGFSVAVDSSGNTYVAGYFRGTVDFDPGANTVELWSRGSEDAFVVKLNSSGVYVWAKRFGGTGYDYGFSVAVDSSGNTYVAGHFSGTADFDPDDINFNNLTSNGSQDAFVVKLNSSGVYVWAKRFGGTDYDYGFSVAVDSSGNTYVAGYFTNSADFDPGIGTANLTSAGNYDAFVVKLNSVGESTPPTTVPVTTVPVTTTTTVAPKVIPPSTSTTVPQVMLPSEPLNVKVTRKSPTSLRVKISWSPPKQREGELTYIVYPREWDLERCITTKLSCEFDMWPGEKYSLIVKARNINGRSGKETKAAKTITAPFTAAMKDLRTAPSEARDSFGRKCNKTNTPKYVRFPVKSIPGFKRVQSSCDGSVFFLGNIRVAVPNLPLFYRDVPGNPQPVLGPGDKSVMYALSQTMEDDQVIGRTESSVKSLLNKRKYDVNTDVVYPVYDCDSQRNDALIGKPAFWSSLSGTLGSNSRGWSNPNGIGCGLKGTKTEKDRYNPNGGDYSKRTVFVGFSWSYDPNNCRTRPCDAVNLNDIRVLQYVRLAIHIRVG